MEAKIIKNILKSLKEQNPSITFGYANGEVFPAGKDCEYTFHEDVLCVSGDHGTRWIDCNAIVDICI